MVPPLVPGNIRASRNGRVASHAAASTNLPFAGGLVDKLLLWIGRLAGLAGVLVFAGAVYARLRGQFIVGDYQVGTLVQASIALMLVGCLGYAAATGERLLRS